MPRRPRIWTQPNVGVDVMNRCIQSRHLLKPNELFNSIVIGALAKAKEKYPVDIFCGAFLSSHFHLYLQADTVRKQALFMAYFTRKLSIESGALYDWKSTTFPDRYHAAEVSSEPEAQIQRLIYHLKNGTKEGLVDSPLDWPGVNFVEALITGEPLKGIWIDRTAYYQARKRDKNVTLDDFTEHLELNITPLPCWSHLDQDTRRQYVLEIIREIEREARDRHLECGTQAAGAGKILAGDPHSQTLDPKKSPQPLFHAVDDEVRRKMRAALLTILAAYYEAAKNLRSGDTSAVFPENTFPPSLPFVEPSCLTEGPDPYPIDSG